MFLVPEDLLNAWRSKQRTEQVDQPVNTVRQEEDSNISSNLNNPNISVYDKMTYHSQHLGKYLNTHNKLHTPSQPPAASIVPPLHSVPKLYKRQAEGLLHTMQNDPAIDWNDKMELTVHNVPYPNSNVVDLIQHAVSRTRKSREEKPVGFEPLQHRFKEMNLPRSLINNPSWLTDNVSIWVF